jgi:hypothetical protein
VQYVGAAARKPAIYYALYVNIQHAGVAAGYLQNYSVVHVLPLFDAQAHLFSNSNVPVGYKKKLLRYCSCPLMKAEAETKSVIHHE